MSVTTTGNNTPTQPVGLSPRTWPVGLFCIYQVLVAAALLGTMWYCSFGAGRQIRFAWDSVLPVWVPFAGALGGCFVSLVGIAMHTVDWDSSRYAYWHLLRPLLGMISGSVSVLILVFVLKGVAPTVMPSTDTPYSASGVAVLFVLSFLVGYREETFRELVKRVVDVVLGPGETEATAQLVLIPNLKVLRSVGGQQVTDTLSLFNSTADTLSLATPLVVIVTPAGVLTCVVQNPDTPIAPKEQRTIDLTWTPGTPPLPMTATVTLTAGGHQVSTRVRGEVT